MSILKIAICQHELSADISNNLETIVKQVKAASKQKVDIVQFPECNLSGYPGIEFNEYNINDRAILDWALAEIKLLASEYSIWIIVGGYTFIEGSRLPYNSLFVFNPRGEQECRYDKRLLTAGDSGDDVDYFIPGSDAVVFNLKGIKCGLLICHEWRYPELYREYKGLGVELIFQSWYDANVDQEEFHNSGRDHGSLIVGSARSYAANNYLWICGSNASNRESSFGSFLIRPDGNIVKKLARNRNGVLVGAIDMSEKFIDPSGHNRINILNRY